MRFRIATWLALLLWLLALGCQDETELAAENSEETKSESITVPEFDSVNTDQVFVYNCGDSLEFTAYVTQDSTWLFLQDTTIKVLSVQAGSGSRYEGGKYLYWSKSNEAILQKPQGSFMTCQSIPQEKSWAAAKLRNVDFRALGQEPGWFVEMNQNSQTQYVGSYGEDTLYFDTPDAQHTDLGRTVYHMQNSENSLTISIRDTSCTDIMSGFEHPQTVSITINDTTTYAGCGRYLQ